MKLYQAIIALLIGGLAIFIEFRSVEELTLFFDWVSSVPFFTLCFLTLLFLLLNARKFVRNKKFTSFLPITICIISIAIIVWHKMNRSSLDNSPTKFTATTYQIGSDGGFILDFKKNGHLKAERRDHWAVTYYWGKYYEKSDTITFDMPLDFQIKRQAILTDTSLNIIGDTISFQVFKL